MNKNVIIWIIVVLFVIGGGFWFRQRNSSPAATIPQSTKLEQFPDSTSAVVPAPGATGAVSEKQVVSGAAGQIAITSGNLFYRPDKLTLTQGEPVTLMFTNTGFHTFTIDELGVDERIEGPSATVNFTPTQAGTFEFYCAVPGHKESGMVGTLVVQ